MPSNYNNAAWFYDRLSRMVFGNTLIEAQTALLHYIPKNAKVLIAGGGTGAIIEAIGKIHPAGLDITFVEISEKMLARARQRNRFGNKVTYINAPVEDTALAPNFDVVITPFLLDSLSPQVFDRVFNNLYQKLTPGALWLNTDFQLTGKWWQKPLLKSMYFFFRMMGCVDVTDLPDMKLHFEKKGLILLNEVTFFGDFIATAVYCKA